MKVLIIFSSGKIGGAERSLTLMTQYSIMNLNKKYVLATIGGENEWSSWVKSLNINPLITSPGKSSISDMIDIARLIKNSDFDVVYAIGLRLSLVLRFLKFIFRMKYTLIHGVRWVPDGTNRLDVATRFIERNFSKFIDGYIANSKACKSILEKNCKINYSKVFTIYNGVKKIDKFNEKSFFKRILTVANMSPRKGYIEYIEVIKKVILKHPNVKFVFVGSDNMNGLVMKSVKMENLSKNVEYLGFLKNVEKEYLSSYIFVLPSLYSEGCPTSIMEAMEYGIPCVAYDICGINELIINGKTGLLANEKDSDMLAQHICNLLESKMIYEQLASKAKLKVKEEFSIESCAKNHFEIFTKLNKRNNL